MRRADLATHKKSNQKWWELVGQFLKVLQDKAKAAGVPCDNNTHIPADFVANVATAEDLKARSASMTVKKPSAMEEEYQDIMGQCLSNLLDAAAHDVTDASAGASSSDDVAVVRDRLVTSLVNDPDAFKAAMAPVVK